MKLSIRQPLRWSLTAAIIGAFALLLVPFAAWFLQRPSPVVVKKVLKPQAKTRNQQAVDFIQAEKFDDAFLAADPEEVRQAFLKEIRLAEVNKDSRLPYLYSGYLEHAPLHRQCWYEDLKDWDNIVTGLQKLEVVPKVAVPDPDRNGEAKAIYDQILAIALRRTKGEQPDTDMADVRRLAEEMLEKCPNSIYCRMAIVAAARLDPWHTEPLTPYLEKMGRRSIPTRLALLRLVADDRRRGRNPDDLERTIAMYREILTTSPVESDRAHAQYEIAQLTFELTFPVRAEEAKQLLEGYWKKYPKSADANWARFYYVQATINQGNLEKSLTLIEQFRQEEPDWSMAATAYVALAGEYLTKGDFAKELEILRRATDNYPGTSAASLAWAKVASRRPNLQLDQEEFDALKRAVMPVTAVIDQPVMDRGEIRQAAKQRLEGIYLSREEWRKCLELCLRPRYGALFGCGDYIDMMFEEECGYVDVCNQHLPDGDPLRQQGIAFLKSHGRKQYASMMQAMQAQADKRAKDTP